MSASVWAPGTSQVSINANFTLLPEFFTAGAGQTVFNLSTFEYVVGTGALLVFKNGLLLRVGIDFTETSSTRFTLTSGANLNDLIVALGFVGITGTAIDMTSALFAPGWADSTPRTVTKKLADWVSIKDFGATSGDITGALLAATAYNRDAWIIIPPSDDGNVYTCSSPISSGGVSQTSRFIGIGKPTIQFSGIAAGTDCWTHVGANYSQAQIENLILDGNRTGRDVLSISASKTPILRNVTCTSSERNAFAIKCSGTDWVEKANFSSLLAENCGLHGYYFELSGAGGAYFNESVLAQCEVRGVSQRANGGGAIWAKCAGTAAGSKISEITLIDCNFDAQRATAIANGYDVAENPVTLEYTAGATNNYESWNIIGGGWETTTGGPDYRSEGLICAQDGVIADGWHLKLGSPNGWSSGGLKGPLTAYFDHDKQNNCVYVPNLNNGTIQSTPAASATFNIDVPIPEGTKKVVNGIEEPSMCMFYELALAGLKFTSTDQQSYFQDIVISYFTSGADQFGVLYGATRTSSVGVALFTVNSVTVLNAAGGATLNAASPPAIVRCNITTTAGWGTAGGDSTFHAIMEYKNKAWTRK